MKAPWTMMIAQQGALRGNQLGTSTYDLSMDAANVPNHARLQCNQGTGCRVVTISGSLISFTSSAQLSAVLSQKGAEQSEHSWGQIWSWSCRNCYVAQSIAKLLLSQWEATKHHETIHKLGPQTFSSCTRRRCKCLLHTSSTSLSVDRV